MLGVAPQSDRLGLNETNLGLFKSPSQNELKSDLKKFKVCLICYTKRGCLVKSRVARFGPKVGQINTKSDKSGTFSNQISLHFNSPSQNVLTSDVNKNVPDLST